VPDCPTHPVLGGSLFGYRRRVADDTVPTSGTWGVICPTTGEMVELPWPPDMTRIADDQEGFSCTCGERHTVTVGPRAARMPRGEE
jgi:hypothetical protein